jgi:hypothetical protein
MDGVCLKMLKKLERFALGEKRKREEEQRARGQQSKGLQSPRGGANNSKTNNVASVVARATEAIG